MAFLFDDQRRLIRKDGSLVERPAKGAKRRGPRRVVISDRVSHLRVDAILGGPGPVREEYERLLDAPHAFVKNLQAWFAARGHQVTYSAINRHRHRYWAQANKAREAAAVARACCDVVKTNGPTALAEAAQTRLEMMLFEELMNVQGPGHLTSMDWDRWGKVITRAIAARRDVEAMREAAKHQPGEAAPRDPDRTGGGKTSREDLAKRMREMLGA